MSDREHTTIWKFTFELADFTTVMMPEGANIIQVGTQSPGRITLWAEVDPTAEMVRHFFNVIGTGHKIPPACSYLGSAFDGPFVWHVYRRAGE